VGIDRAACGEGRAELSMETASRCSGSIAANMFLLGCNSEVRPGIGRAPNQRSN
jgi:hypothetical protein